MRICMVLEKAFPPDIRVEKEARSLTKAGHKVVVLCNKGPNQVEEEDVKSLKIRRLGKPAPLAGQVTDLIWRFFLINPRWLRRIIKTVKEEGCQVVCVHDLPLVKTGILAARMTGVPITADLHENYPEAMRLWRNLSFRERFLLGRQRFKRLELKSVRRVDHIIVVVDEAKKRLVSLGIPKDKISVVMNTEEADFLQKQAIHPEIIDKFRNRFVISYIGGFGFHRGIDVAVKAFPLIMKTVPDAHLLLVGDGNNKQELEDLCKELNLNEKVTFTGWVDSRYVPTYIAASDIGLVPHRKSPHTDTTIPHKLFQYMTSGKPVVTSDAEPLKRIVSDAQAGLVFPSGDSKKLAGAVVRLRENKELARRLGENGRKAVATRYNWEIEGKKLVDSYERLATDART